MTLPGRNVLLVGHTLHSGRALTDRLRRWGFRCYFADNMRAASDLLSSQPVDLVLTNTCLSDGTGFSLLVALDGIPVTAFLCLPVESSCFWLPAIDSGKSLLGITGSPALGIRERPRRDDSEFRLRRQLIN